MHTDSCKYSDVCRTKWPKTSSTKRKTEAPNRCETICTPLCHFRWVNWRCRCGAQHTTISSAHNYNNFKRLILGYWLLLQSVFLSRWMAWVRRRAHAHKKDKATSDQLKWIFNECFYGPSNLSTAAVPILVFFFPVRVRILVYIK